MSPRRSSRARGTQPPPPAPVHTNSSTSSVTSGRQERSTRSSQKQASPRRSNPRSQSLDDAEDTKQPLRRTRSSHDEVKITDTNDNEEPEEDDKEEEDVTRCICGQADYPGLPAYHQEHLKQQAKQPGAKYPLSVINEDLGSIFLQCDSCKVWQHGGCVGIFGDTTEDYFCEKCRSDLHEVIKSADGTVVSIFLPLKNETSPNETPEPAPRDRARRNDGRNRPAFDPPKRRSTMNSREIYDEAEEFLRAIEESKRDAVPGENGRRKRARDEPDETKPSVKRQRTGSKSNSPTEEKPESSSDEALAVKSALENTPKKNIRGAAARNHAAKEAREQKAREQAKAAESRKTRMERRRGNESEHENEPQSTPRSASTPPAPEQPAPRSNPRKKGKAKRTGRNQYTKDRDNPNTLDPGDPRSGRGRSRSRSLAPDDSSPKSLTAHFTDPPSTTRPSKIKHLNPARTSMNEMKKRIAAIMEYVNRAEDEMNRQAMIAASTSSNTSSGSSVASAATTATVATATVGTVPDEYKAVAAAGEGLDFAGLPSREMVRVLKARLVAWEDEYGRYPR